MYCLVWSCIVTQTWDCSFILNNAQQLLDRYNTLMNILYYQWFGLFAYSSSQTITNVRVYMYMYIHVYCKCQFDPCTFPFSATCDHMYMFGIGLCCGRESVNIVTKTLAHSSALHTKTDMSTVRLLQATLSAWSWGILIQSSLHPGTPLCCKGH